MDHRRGRAKWGPGQPRSRTSADYWREPLRWDRQANKFFAEHGRRRRVFCASLADVFDNEVDPQWRRDLFDLIRATPNLDWLLLTKRIGIAQRLFDDCHAYLADFDQRYTWPENVWLGATVVNQEEVDRDVPKLLATSARVRFLSVEPMLGPIDLAPHFLKCCGGFLPGSPGDYWTPPDPPCCCNEPEPTELHWVICGGESGPNARPMFLEWARSLRDQCAGAGVPFLFKQYGEWLGLDYRSPCLFSPLMEGGLGARVDGKEYTKSDVIGWSAPGVRHVTSVAVRVGKKRAGRLLDGVEHNGYPGAQRDA